MHFLLKKREFFWSITKKHLYLRLKYIVRLSKGNCKMKSMSIIDPALDKGYGLLDTLERKMSPAEVRRLERLGYIENAISPKGATWRLSDKGKRMRNNLKKESSIATRCSDFFFKKVLRYNVSLE